MVARHKDAIAIDGPRWTAFATVHVRVSPVAKADARGRVVVVVVVVSSIVKRRAVKITLTCFNLFHIFLVVAVYVFFPVDSILEHEHCRNTKSQLVFYINYNHFTA